MIGRLRGALARCGPDAVLVEVGGVGYELQIPLSTFYALSGREGDEVTLHVHTHVREDALQLFGFATLEERRVFALCLGVSGVGPRLALAVLSGIGAEDLERAVLEEDRARLQGIPGVGRKTAERLLLELRDRFTETRRPARPGGEAPGTPGEGVGRDAVSALTNLGFAAEAARRAVQRALEGREDAAETPALEDVLKAALTRLVH